VLRHAADALQQRAKQALKTNSSQELSKKFSMFYMNWAGKIVTENSHLKFTCRGTNSDNYQQEVFLCG
jgi:glycine cleavage system H lipoate-binding protein